MFSLSHFWSLLALALLASSHANADELIDELQAGWDKRMASYHQASDSSCKNQYTSAFIPRQFRASFHLGWLLMPEFSEELEQILETFSHSGNLSAWINQWEKRFVASKRGSIDPDWLGSPSIRSGRYKYEAKPLSGKAKFIRYLLFELAYRAQKTADADSLPSSWSADTSSGRGIYYNLMADAFISRDDFAFQYDVYHRMREQTRPPASPLHPQPALRKVKRDLRNMSAKTSSRKPRVRAWHQSRSWSDLVEGFAENIIAESDSKTPASTALSWIIDEDGSPQLSFESKFAAIYYRVAADFSAFMAEVNLYLQLRHRDPLVLGGDVPNWPAEIMVQCALSYAKLKNIDPAFQTYDPNKEFYIHPENALLRDSGLNLEQLNEITTQRN